MDNQTCRRRIVCAADARSVCYSYSSCFRIKIRRNYKVTNIAPNTSDQEQHISGSPWRYYKLLASAFLIRLKTRSSAVAERPRDASCSSVVSFNIPTGHFLLLVTAASDLLVHKILLNSVLLSFIVSGGVRPKPPGQTPLGHNPPCLLPFVGRLGSRVTTVPRGLDRVRSTG